MNRKALMVLLGAVLAVAGIIAYQATDRVVMNNRRQSLETQGMRNMCADLEKNGGHSGLCQKYNR